MLYALTINPWIIILAGAGIIFGAVGIGVLQFQFLMENMHMNFVPGEVNLEEDIAIVVAAFGVFLDNRRWLVRGRYGDNVPDHEQTFSELCQKFGVGLILMGIFIEVVDLGFLALDNFGFTLPMIRYSEVGFMFLLNLGAIFILVRLLTSVLSARKGQDLPPHT
ncbi:MAG: hypothetical protein JJ900_08515 [Rhodospirillales bacterium]|nr:hypothetical protein [Rhodospirillales bacterium]MBO6786880.1 hypothetical protein [Rhodospirillales bacterium]